MIEVKSSVEVTSDSCFPPFKRGSILVVEEIDSKGKLGAYTDDEFRIWWWIDQKDVKEIVE